MTGPTLIFTFLTVAALSLLVENVASSSVSTLPNLSNNLLPGPTVGGFSSGGAMAANLHVIYSSIFSGAAGFGCAFYHCNSGHKSTSTKRCYSNKTSVATSIAIAHDYEKQGLVDPLSNLANAKTFFWSGTNDKVVQTAVTLKNAEFYRYFTSVNNSKFVKMLADHVVPTDNDGPICPTPSLTHVGDCSFDGIYQMFAHFYGANNIIKPSGTVSTSQIVYFDQKEFTQGRNPKSIGLDNTGFYYKPSACTGSVKCRLHFYLHGCTGGNQAYIRIFMERIGLYKLAERNNIVMVFPRAAPSRTINQQGCWDVLGYNNDAFATKKGIQVEFFKSILNRLYGDEQSLFSL